MHRHQGDVSPPWAITGKGGVALLPQDRQASVHCRRLHGHVPSLLAVEYRLDRIGREEGQVNYPAHVAIRHLDPRRDLAER
jgi:hypothetical protein